MIAVELREPVPTAAEVLAHIRAGCKLQGRTYGGEYEWTGTRDQMLAVGTHYKNITRHYERGKSRPKNS